MESMSYAELVMHGSVRESKGPAMKIQNSSSPLPMDVKASEDMGRPP